MKEYKVLTLKDKWSDSRFDPPKLEATLNTYAKQGWRVIAVATAKIPGIIGNNREELIVILERDK